MLNTYTVYCNNCSLEDVLHRLFTQLYDDDLLFDLKINSDARESEVVFTTLFSEDKVERVMSSYNVD